MKTNKSNSVGSPIRVPQTGHANAPAPRCTKLRMLALALLLSLSSALHLRADVSVFQEGVNSYAGTEDTELRENPGEANTPQGAVGNVTVDNADPSPYRTVGLIRFNNIFGSNPGQIPPGTNILTAKLRIRTTNPGSAGAHAHRMLFDWAEATATWNSVAGSGNGSPGVQADDVDSTTTDHDGDLQPGITFPNVNVVDTFTEIDVTADVQAWSDGTAPYGWAILANGTDGWDWPSSEGAIIDHRPRLFVEWGVAQPPIFTLQPTNITVEQTRTATFTVAVIGSEPITVQWLKDGFPIDPLINPSATTTTLTIPNAQDIDEGTYVCRAVNAVDTTDSDPAVLTVDPDVTAPVVIGALGGAQFDRITVQFSEPMDSGTVLDTFNWGVLDEANNAVPLMEPGGIALSAEGSVVTLILATGTLLAENSLYTIFIQGLLDKSTVNVLEQTNVVFRSFVSGCNSFLWEAFDTASTPGNAVTLLTSHPNFPDNPRDFARIPTWDSRHGYPDDSHEQFGGRIRGLFVPQVSGKWIFFHRSDDAGELWLNPTGPDSAGRQLIAAEGGCCGNFRPLGDARTSVPIDLVAGQPYYMESLYKEGGGGDWLKVAARLASEPIDPAGFGDATAGLDSFAIPASAAPAGVLGHITIANNPADQSVIAGNVATFSVGLSLDVPACYQWKRDGIDIAGAIRNRHEITTTLADDGAQISVTVTLLGGTVLNSTPATLDVINDTTPPTALSAAADVAGTNITVVFSEPMDPSAVSHPLNYQVDGGAANIVAVTVVNPSTVRVSLDAALAACVNHTIRISDVQDQFLNLISPNPTTLSFTTPLPLVLLDAVHSWRYNDSGTDQGNAWRASAFDDSTWSNGMALFAFESGALPEPIRTPVLDPRTIPTPGAAYYYRTHFDLPTDPSTITQLALRHVVDDGLVMYINGAEVYRIGMPAGDPLFNTFASRAPDNAVWEGPFTIPTDALAFGDNVIAVEVHQQGAGSSDSVFGLELIATVDACTGPRPRLSISVNGNQATITSTDPGGTIYSAASLDGPWTSVGPAPQTVTIGAGNLFFEIRP